MKSILVLYATRDGHTQRIAEHVAASIVARGYWAEAVNAVQIPVGFTFDTFSGVIIAASVHCGHHEREIVELVKSHVRELNRIPTIFLSISLSQAGAEDSTAPPARRAQAAADAARMIDDFLTETAWQPGKIKAVGGALLYTKQFPGALVDDAHCAACGGHNRHVKGPRVYELGRIGSVGW